MAIKDFFFSFQFVNARFQPLGVYLLRMSTNMGRAAVCPEKEVLLGVTVSCLSAPCHTIYTRFIGQEFCCVSASLHFELVTL